MGTNYISDRIFTNFIHDNLALKYIYPKLNWKINPFVDDIDFLDINKGIDYVFTDKNNKKIFVQERFRDKKYSSFNDFTIRYRRDFNFDKSRVESEYFKINADYHVYGVVNVGKSSFKNASKFLKFAVIDLKKIYENIKTGSIQIGGISGYRCLLKGNKMICPIVKNRDYSSTFVPFDITYLNKLFKDECIILQEGYI